MEFAQITQRREHSNIYDMLNIKWIEIMIGRDGGFDEDEKLTILFTLLDQYIILSGDYECDRLDQISINPLVQFEYCWKFVKNWYFCGKPTTPSNLCNICSHVKSLDNFYKTSGNVCKLCILLRNRQLYHINRFIEDSGGERIGRRKKGKK